MPSPEAPIDGRWIQHLTQAEMRRFVEAIGMGRWVDGWFTAEEVTGPQRVVWTFGGGHFAVAYFMPDGSWYVGWKGAMEVDGELLTLHDDFSGSTDVYRMRVRGDSLWLARKSPISGRFKGIPIEVYDAGYLSEPLVRTDCPLVPGEPC